MPVQKQNIPISFGSGIDTKTDPNQVITGTFLNVSNVSFTEGVAFKKKNGFQSLSTLNDGLALSTFQGELVSYDANHLYSYSPSSESNIQKGPIISLSLEAQAIFRNANSQTQQDSAYNPAGVFLFCYQDSVNASQYVVVSATTGQRLLGPVTLPGTPINPRAWSLGQYVLVTWVDSTTHHLRYVAVPVLNPTSPGSATDLATNVNTTHAYYDGVICNGALYLSWNASDGGGAIRTTYLDSHLNQHNVLVEAGEAASGCIGVFADNGVSTPNIWVAYYNGTDIKYFIATSNSVSEVLAPTVIVAATGILNINGYANNNAGLIYYQTSHDYSYASIRSDFLSSVSATSTGSVGTPVVFLRSVGLISHWFEYNGIMYCVVAYNGSTQPTYFIVNDSAQVVGKIAYTNGGGYAAQSSLCSVNQLSTSVFEFAYLYKDALDVESGVLYSNTGVNSAQFDFNSPNAFQSADIGLNLNIGGGFLWSYDSTFPVEQNFHLGPEDLYATNSTSGSPNIAAGTYSYIAVYQWTDIAGNINRSVTSPALSVTIASTSSITVNIPTLRLTYKISNPVSITLYRTMPTIAVGIWYRVSSISSPTLNSVTVDSVTIVDNLADVAGQELLYTTGGVVDDTGAPGSTGMTIYRNRLWLIDAEDQNLLWYSKQVIESTPVEMSDLFTYFVDPRFGNLTALAVLDDKLILFKADAIFYITGDGPDDTGANSDFSDPVFITSNVGCTNLNSIVIMPDGIMFQSNKGIWLLDRGLEVSYIGAPVEQYNSNPVTSAQLIPNSTEVRFTLNQSFSLMYDYFYKRWSVPTSSYPLASVVFQGLHTYLSKFGEILQEDPGTYSENGEPVLMSVQTGWLSLAGFQGFERAYRLYLKGQFLSAHQVVVSLAYDYNPAIVQSTVISPLQLANTNYGDDPVYGSENTYGGVSQSEQWRINFTRQKCQSVMIIITEILDTSNPVFGPGLVLESMGVTLGIKSSYPRLPPSQIVGGS